MEDCIFCKIVKNEIPSTKIYEDDKFLSFLDIEPVSDGHLLVIPKRHIIWMQDADDETIANIFKLTKKLMLAVRGGIKCDYVQINVSGEEVPHFHIHLIPRYFNDQFPKFVTKTYKGSEKEEAAKKIIQEL